MAPDALAELLDAIEAALDAGRLDQARAGLATALARAPGDIRTLCLAARLRGRAGKGAQARAMLAQAARQAPESPLPSIALGHLCLAEGQLRAALAAFKLALPRDDGADALLGLAAVLERAGQRAEASAVLEAACARRPGDAALRVRLATELRQLGRLDAAQAALEAARAADPEDGPAARALGRMLLDGGDPLGAQRHLADAARLLPEDSAVWHNLGLAYKAGGASTRAIDAHREAVRRAPEHPDLLTGLGNALSGAGAHGEAVACLDRARQLRPGDATIRTNLGAACLRAGHPTKALPHLDAAIAAAPTLAQAWRLRGAARQARGELDLALEDLREGARLVPDGGDAQPELLALLRSRCAWSETEALALRQDAANADRIARGGRCPESPYDHLIRSDDAAVNLRIARSWAPIGHARPPLPAVEGPIHVGYLSADLRDHAVGWLVDGLFAAHDRDRVSVTLFRIGPRDGSDQERRLEAEADGVVDLEGLADPLAAERIRAAAPHVLVDLMGHTRHNRLPMLALRPAPIQATWLGHPGTTGADFIDYILLDGVIAPPGVEHHFSERVARLPCYQANGPLRPLPPAPPRAAEGLPDGAVVLACSNRPEKIDPASFAWWMAVLRGAPQAVLWLWATAPAARAHLRQAAAGSGVDPARLFFAAHRAHDAHLARLQCIDLGLDTLVYGAHTTASDLLRAGVPMLTVPGAGVAARVGASLLTRCGLQDALVVETPGDAVERAMQLVHDPDALAALRARVRRSRALLFDPSALARSLEDHFEAWVDAR